MEQNVRILLKKIYYVFLMFVAVLPPASAGEKTSLPNSKKELSSSGKHTILPPLITEKYAYHDVCGCNAEDLQCDLTKKAFKCRDGNTYDSITKWKVAWDYGYRRSDAGCYADAFKLTVDIVVHLPKWVDAGQAPQFLVQKWDAYINNLIRHEQGHRDRVLAAAADLARAVADIPPARFCWQMGRQIEHLSRNRLQTLIEEQEEYDAATNHGHTEGAAFPVSSSVEN